MIERKNIACLNGTKQITFLGPPTTRRKKRAFGGWLKYERRMRQLTIRELSRRTGIDGPRIHKLERIEVRPTIEEAAKLEAAMGLEIGTLSQWLGIENAGV